MMVITLLGRISFCDFLSLVCGLCTVLVCLLFLLMALVGYVLLFVALPGH